MTQSQSPRNDEARMTKEPSRSTVFGNWSLGNSFVIRTWDLVILSRQERLERAFVATRRARPAEMLPDHHQLRVIILPVIQPRRAGLLIQRRFAKRFQFIVAVG